MLNFRSTSLSPILCKIIILIPYITFIQSVKWFPPIHFHNFLIEFYVNLFSRGSLVAWSAVKETLKSGWDSLWNHLWCLILWMKFCKVDCGLGCLIRGSYCLPVLSTWVHLWGPCCSAHRFRFLCCVSVLFVFVLCLRVSHVVSVSELTILDCSFAFLLCLFEHI